MIATLSKRTARANNTTAKLAFRGGAMAPVAAVIAFGLFAAPLYAQEASDLTVTLGVSVAADGMATLSPTTTPTNDPRENIGFQFQDRQGTNSYDDQWWDIGVAATHYIDRSFWLGNGPFYVRARAWKMRNDAGEWTLTYSDPSPEVEVVLPQ